MFQGKEFFRRVSKVLAIYADLELCSSVLGLELDTETANRIQLVFTTHLEVSSIQRKSMHEFSLNILSLLILVCRRGYDIGRFYQHETIMPRSSRNFKSTLKVNTFVHFALFAYQQNEVWFSMITISKRFDLDSLSRCDIHVMLELRIWEKRTTYSMRK